MIAEYDPSEDKFVLWVGLHETDIVKKIPGASWKEWRRNPHGGDPGAWLVAANWPAYVAINGIFSYALQPAPSYTDWGQSLWTTRFEGLTRIRFEQDANIGDGPTPARLWPLQRVAVQAMVWAERYLELDDMGGGKTVTALSALRYAAAMYGHDEVFPAIVVCPNKVRRSWRKIALEEVGDGNGPLWGDLRMEILPKGKPAQMKMLARFTDPAVPPEERPQVLVANWEALASLSRIEKFGREELTEKESTPGPLNAIDWRTVIADEAHRMKDKKAKQTRAVKAIAFGTWGKCQTRPARFRWALTGTPVANDAAESWSLLNFLDEVAYPAYTRYAERYASMVYNGWGQMEVGGLRPENREEFYAAFLPYSIRRTREQFDPFKPQRVELTMTVPMETKQAKAYNDMSKTMLAQLDGGVLSATEAVHKSNRLYQLTNSFGEMVDKGRQDPLTGETIQDLLLKAPSNKVNAMLELVDDFGITSRGGAGRAIVFGSTSRQLIAVCEEALKKRHITYTLIAGGMSDGEQDRQERMFELGTSRIALCVIAAAREGLNSLVRADTLVFLNKSHSNLDNSQFKGRIDRPGQAAKSVTFIDVVSEGTLEEFLQKEQLAGKERTFQDIVADARVLKAMLEFKGGAV